MNVLCVPCWLYRSVAAQSNNVLTKIVRPILGAVGLHTVADEGYCVLEFDAVLIGNLLPELRRRFMSLGLPPGWRQEGPLGLSQSVTHLGVIT